MQFFDDVLVNAEDANLRRNRLLLLSRLREALSRGRGFFEDRGMNERRTRSPQNMPRSPRWGRRREAGGGGARAERGKSPREARPQSSRASPPQSALRADSSPIEGEQGFVSSELSDDQAMGLRLRRRRERGRCVDEDAARRQGREPGRDGQARAAGAARASRSRRKSAPSSTRTSAQYPAELAAQVDAALAALEKKTGKKFGDPANPLLVSVRSGARASMPGMMDTVLNLGLNDETVEGLAKLSGDARFAYDSYRRFIQMYSDVVLELEHGVFEEILGAHKDQQRLPLRHRDWSADDWKEVVAAVQARRRARARQAVPERSEGAALGRDRRGVLKLDERSRDLLSQAQQHSRKLGHRRQRAGDGVRQYGRDLAPPASPSRAIPRPARRSSTASILINAQGEDVVAGIRTPKALTKAARDGDEGAGQVARRSDARKCSPS